MDEPVVWYEGAGVGAANRRYTHADHQGSVIAVSDAAGTVLGVNRYDPYGVPSAGNIGRFMQTDPIGYDDDLNLYAYVGGDPVNKTDPTGQIGETPWDIANVVMDVASLAGNVASGNVGGALVDAAGLAYDVAATVVPGLPGGAGTLIKAGRVGEALEASAKAVKGAHGNKIDDRPATLYAKYDKDGNFLKWGVTKHENPSKRYTRSQIDGGTVRPLERGARSEMIKKERDLVERSPDPANREPWAGKAQCDAPTGSHIPRC